MIAADKILGVDKVLFHYFPEKVGSNPVTCVGHMIGGDRFPESGVLSSFLAYAQVLDKMYHERTITDIITGGTHGGDSFAIWWALLNGVRIHIVRPYNELDHLEARIPKGSPSLVGWYNLYEAAFQRAVKQGRIDVYYPEVSMNFISTEHLTEDEMDYLHTHQFIPTKVIAMKLGKSVLNDTYSCFNFTNATMLSILSGGQCKRMVALWNGKEGEKPGGTAHAVRYAVLRLNADPVIVTAGLGEGQVQMPADLQNFVFKPAF